MAVPTRDVAAYLRECELIGLRDEAFAKYVLQCLEWQERYEDRIAKKEEADRIAKKDEADRIAEKDEADRIVKKEEAEAERAARESEAKHQF